MKRLFRFFGKKRGQPEGVSTLNLDSLEKAESYITEASEYILMHRIKREKDESDDRIALDTIAFLNRQRNRRLDNRETIYNALTFRQNAMDFKLKKSTRENLARIISREIK